MTVWGAKLHNLEETDLDITVWRYLTFPKFIHMISYGALWFARLQSLQDKAEGRLPAKTERRMNEELDGFRNICPSPEFQKQIDNITQRNVRDGRSLIAVNCWFMSENECERMWHEYVGSNEGIAVKSTIRKLRDNVHVPSEFSQIGRVRYVDFEKFDISTYEGNQANHRAFLKDRDKFKHENELRIATLNFRTSACLSPIGLPLTPEELSGSGTNNFDEDGLIVRMNIDKAFDTIVTAPNAPDWLFNLITQLSLPFSDSWSVQRSEL